MKNRKKRILFSVIFCMMVFGSGRVNGSLIAKPGVTSLQTTANDLFEKVRQMEASGGTLGLDATIEEITYVDSSKNGVDVHMARNTEWGSAALLSASIYGTAPIGKSNETTTGNSTGIYQMADGMAECVAGIYNKIRTRTYISKIAAADNRYYNLYGDTITDPSDATIQTAKWKESQKYNACVRENWPIFVRGYNAIFGVILSDGNTGENLLINETGGSSVNGHPLKSTRAVLSIAPNL